MKGRMNRRQFLHLCAGLSGAALLAACAPKPAEPAAPEAPAEQGAQAPEEAAAPAGKGPAKLIIIFRNQDPEPKMVDDWNKAFNATHADIQVEGLYVAFAESEPKLMSMYAAGEPPDIYGTTGVNPYAERYLRGMVLALQPLLDKEGPELLADAWPIAVNAFRIDNKMYSLPIAMHAAGTWINATRLDEAGVEYPPVDWSKKWTWEEMVETGKKLVKVNGDKTEQFGVTFDHARAWYLTRVWGQDIVPESDKGTGVCRKLQLDKQEVYEACLAGLEARKALTWTEHVSPTPDESGPLSQIGPLLLTGAVAMQVGGPWALWGELPQEFKFRGAVMPTGGVNGSGTTCKNTWAEPFQISSKAKNPDAAWEYVKWVAFDSEAISIGMNYRNCMSVSKAGYEVWYKQYGDKLAMTEEESRTFWNGSLEQAETTVPDHLYLGWAKIRDLDGAEFQPGWENKKSMKECLDSFIPKANQALADVAKELGLS